MEINQIWVPQKQQPTQNQIQNIDSNRGKISSLSPDLFFGWQIFLKKGKKLTLNT